MYVRTSIILCKETKNMCMSIIATGRILTMDGIYIRAFFYHIRLNYICIYICTYSYVPSHLTTEFGKCMCTYVRTYVLNKSYKALIQKWQIWNCELS